MLESIIAKIDGNRSVTDTVNSRTSSMQSVLNTVNSNVNSVKTSVADLASASGAVKRVIRGSISGTRYWTGVGDYYAYYNTVSVDISPYGINPNKILVIASVSLVYGSYSGARVTNPANIVSVSSTEIRLNTPENSVQPTFYYQVIEFY